MAGHIQYIVNPAHDPVIAVLVAMRGITRHVVLVIELRPIGVDIALVVAPDRAENGRPGFGHHQITASLN